MVEKRSAANATAHDPSRKVQNADNSIFLILFLTFESVGRENGGSLGMGDLVVNRKVFIFSVGNR